MGITTAKASRASATITISIIESKKPGMSLDFLAADGDGEIVAKGSIAKQPLVGWRTHAAIETALSCAKEHLTARLMIAEKASGRQS